MIITYKVIPLQQFIFKELIIMLFDEVKEILVDQLDIKEDTIELDSGLFDDLDMDSLDAIDLAMTIEDQYSIEVPDDVIKGFKTVEDVVSYIESNID